MIDGNNLPGDAVAALYGSGKGIVLNTENSRIAGSGSRRNSLANGSAAAEYAGIPLPSELKVHHEILMLIMSGDTQSVKAMILSIGARQVVGIRGLNLQIDDIEDSGAEANNEEEYTGTAMWNPLHFAVYYQNMELIKFLIKELKINLAMTAPKARAESERDASNSEKYTEDKIMILLLAYDRRNHIILKYLLDEGCRFWPSKKTIEKLLKERLLEEVIRFTTELSINLNNNSEQQQHKILIQ